MIGTAADGTSALGNGGSGVVFLSGSGIGMNTVGGSAAGAANTIAFNARGVHVESGTTRQDVSRNSIHSNTGLGIDLGTTGVTPNDTDDPDTGANNLQNFPVLDAATAGGGETEVSGTLNSEASKTYRIEFFSNPSCDPSGNGEGKTFLGSTNATTDANGDVAFNATLTTEATVGDAITATATDPGGNTSEFSACEEVAEPAPPATITGTKFHDQNRDGVHDAGDPGLANWTIRAYTDANQNQQLDAGETTIAASDSTDANGDYSLTVEAGDYVVCEVLQSGWAQSLPQGADCSAISALADGGHPFALAAGDAETGADFGNYQPSVIPCTPDGSNDVVEAAPPADLRLNRYESNQCMFLFSEQQDVTLSQGLAVDSSPVRGNGGAATLPAGSELTSHILHADKVGNSGQVVSFDGSYTFTEPVVGLIWQGTKLNNTDNLLGTPGDGTTSGLDYEASASAREFETNNAPGGGNDSAVVSGDGLTVTFHTGQTIGADEVRVLTGTVPEPATITGTKFHDQNRDGVHDAGDPGLANWTIRAYTDANQNQQLDAGETTIAASDSTDANGDYSLTVEAGDYVVCEVLQSGWAQSLPQGADCSAISALADGGHPFALAAGDAETGADFGNYQPSVIPCTPDGSNDVVEAAPPADLRLNRYESNQCMFLFSEQQDVTLSQGLAVDSSPVRGNGGAATLPAGSELTSHILHADKVGNSGQVVSFDGSYTFTEPVVGLIWQGTKLNNTDNLLGTPGDGTTSGLDYEASASAREFETNNAPGGGNDSAVVSGDGLTVTFHTGQTIGADEVRVLTGTVPEPATITGTKFHDQNRDGVHDAGDPGLANWTIRAYTDANQNQQLDSGETTIAASDTTDANGDYSLTVEAGDYVVCEVAQSGWAQSCPPPAARLQRDLRPRRRRPPVRARRR